MMKKPDAAILATAAVLAAALAGSRYTPGRPKDAAWYARLEKPEWRPSGAAIGVAWTVLDVLMAYGGARLLAAPPTPARRVAVTGWGAAVAGLAAYPFLMFGRHRLGAALGVAVGMLGGALTAVVAGAGIDRRAAGALLPLVGWLGLASALQEELWRRNRG